MSIPEDTSLPIISADFIHSGDCINMSDDILEH